MAFYCVTWYKQKSREPTTPKSDELSACTLSVSVSDKLLRILPYHCKLHDFSNFFGNFFTAPLHASVAK